MGSWVQVRYSLPIIPMPILLLQLPDAVDLLPVPGALGFALRDGRVEPRVQDLVHDGDRGRTEAEGQHVRVVPDSCPAGRLRVVCQRGPDAGHLVGGDACPGARPAASDTFIC